ncbi:MAG: ABC transporter permease [Acidimicrobiales bacterium]
MGVVDVRGATAMWAAADFRQRWRSLVLLGVLAGLSAGLCMAALAGARRTSTAFARLRDHTHSADAVVFATQVGILKPNWSKLEAQPYVGRVARWNLLFGSMDGRPGGLMFAPSDDIWLQKVDRPVVVQGRMFDVHRPDEVVVDEGLLKKGVRVGSKFRFRFYQKGKSDLDGKPPTGPELQFRVVGVVRETSQFLFTDGQILPSPALMRENGSRISAFENAHVRLRDWRSGLPKLKRDAGRLVGPGVPVLDLHQVETRVSTSIAVEHGALLLLAAAVAAAAFVFVGQALVRSVTVITSDVDALRSLGFTRWDMITAATIPHVAVAAVAMAVGAGTAIALSPRFPIGLARRVDPGRGVHLDLTVLVPGAVVTVLVVIIGCAAMASRVGHVGRARTLRSWGLMSRFRNTLPLPVGLGTTMALDGGAGRRTLGARFALIGAVAGILGLSGSVTVLHGLDDALANPARVGVTWDAGVTPEATAVDPKASDLLHHDVLNRIRRSPGVGDVSVTWRAVLDANGVGVATFSTVAERGRIDLVTVAGRVPRSDTEVAIGPATARQFGVDIGDDITVAKHRLRIVGRALFPTDVHSGFDEGLLVNFAVLKRLAPPPDPETGGGPFPYFAIRWAGGTDPKVGLAALTRSVDDPSAEVAAALVPLELTNLRSVRQVPRVLAAFLVFIAISTLAHSLLTNLRSRRSEFAVLRAVGFTRRMLAIVVGSHSTVVGLVGLVVGIPLGLAGGRLIWNWVALRVPLVYASPIVVGVTLVLVPLVLAAVNLVAAWPARRAGRLRIAEVLRAE